LNRTPEAAGAAAWQRRLDGGASAAAVALAILHSTEARGRMVQGLYHEFLGRDAEPTGQAHFVELLRRGRSDDEVLAAIAGSAEGFARMSG
jgi:hypothetical protein